MIIKAAVLIPGDNHQAVVPQRRVTDGLICTLNQRLSASHVVERVLRSAAPVFSRRVVAGFNKRALSENLEDTPFSLGFRGLERQG